MKSIFFPKNVWKKIKSFEFQLLYPEEYKIESLNNIKLIINNNYFVLIEGIYIPKLNYKIDTFYHYNYIKKNHPHYFRIFSDRFIIRFIDDCNNDFFFHNRL